MQFNNAFCSIKILIMQNVVLKRQKNSVLIMQNAALERQKSVLIMQNAALEHFFNVAKCSIKNFKV